MSYVNAILRSFDLDPAQQRDPSMMSSELVFPRFNALVKPARKIEHLAEKLFWPSYIVACAVLALSMLCACPVYVMFYGAQVCAQLVYVFKPDLYSQLVRDQPIYTALGVLNDVAWVALHWPLVARWAIYQLVPCSSPFGELWSDYSLTIGNVWNIVQLILWSFTGPFGAVFGYIHERDREKEWYTSVYKGSPFLPETNQTTFYINGVCTTSGMHVTDCRKLEHQLNRRVIGIYNPSYGVISDVIECIMQRNLGLDTPIVRATESVILDELMKGRKVELIAHSQGGIIASLAVFGVAVKWAAHRANHHHAEPLSRLLNIITYASAAKSFPDCGVRQPSTVDTEQLPQRNIVHLVNYASTNYNYRGMSYLTNFAGDLVALNVTQYRVNRAPNSVDRMLNLGVYGRVLISKSDKAGHWLGAFYDVDVDPYQNYVPIADSVPQWKWL